MKDTFYPMCVVTAVPTTTGLRFLHPKTQYNIDAYTEEIWALIAECSGHASENDVVASAMKALRGRSSEGALSSILNELRGIGVVIDSREYYKYAHGLTENPMFYSYNMTFSDVTEYTSRPRLPVFDGVSYPVEHQDTALSSLLAKRKSCRSFASDAIPNEQLKHILAMAYCAGGSQTPSAGGLYSLKLYVILTKEHGPLPAGYYEYDSSCGKIVLYREGVDREALEYAFNSETLLYGASAILVIAGDMERHTGKYSNRGYRYTILEAGHAAQNVQLASTEMGLGCLEYGGFLDGVLGDELDLGAAGVSALICLALGSAGDAVEDSQETLSRLESELVGSAKPVRYVRISAGAQPWKGDSFFAAAALHKPGPHQHARRSYEQRFVGGTGTSSVVAEIKAIAEAYERYASTLVRTDAVLAASEISGRWIDPNQVAPWTDEQWNLRPFLRPFSEMAQWEWVEGEAMRDGKPVLVPVELAFYPLSANILGRQLCHEGNSSGVAAFTSEVEATKRALLELIERDTFMRTWLTRKSPKRISVEALSIHWRRRADHWSGQGRSVHILDLSAYGVAVANVVITSPDAYPCFVSGAAASLDSFEAAAAKAFHEAELVLLHMTKSKKLARIRPERVVDPMDHARLYAHPDHLGNIEWLWRGEELAQTPLVGTDMAGLVDLLDPVMVRLSSRDAPLNVVRVLCEQLVPVNFGYGTEYHAHPSLQGAVDPDSLVLPHFFA